MSLVKGAGLLEPGALVEIEAARANPSLGSLHDLASALGTDIVTLVERGAGPRSIALLGLRGAGKSTKIGRAHV